MNNRSRGASLLRRLAQQAGGFFTFTAGHLMGMGGTEAAVDMAGWPPHAHQGRELEKPNSLKGSAKN
ncbi:hypothetical protein GQ55_9G539100 [Panicum hallii var. hallii]|uniref:Uncharacterized protein n=1 Tax=Panicum hallii var. hallii TaxID=1504633 RepID=A0A2T7CEZ9_9POAL|nr:hypothetical protein GQ55_9G539100 [Panicum hallii var. hallii]